MKDTRPLFAFLIVVLMCATLSMTSGAPATRVSSASQIGFGQGAGCGGPVRAPGLREISGFIIAADRVGNIFLAAVEANSVSKLASDGKVSIVAGNGQSGFSGDGGPATSATLDGVRGLAVDASGNLFIAVTGSPRVRKVSPTGTITTVAGSGVMGVGGDGGPALSAPLCPAIDIAVDGIGNLFIATGGGTGADSALPGDYRVRKVDTKGVITTVSGSGRAASGRAGPPQLPDGASATAGPIFPLKIGADASGNLYIVEPARIRKVNTAGVISTIAGDGTSGSVKEGGPATASQFGGGSLVLDATGNVFILSAASQILKVTPAGIITVVAGSGTRGFGGDGIQARSSPIGTFPRDTMNTGSKLAVDGAGNLFVSESKSEAGIITRRIRKISTDGSISTVLTSTEP